MYARIVSLSGVVHEGEIASITLPTTSGEITVLPHHRALISVVKEGIVRLSETNGKESTYPVTQGFVEVDRDSNVTVLVG